MPTTIRSVVFALAVVIVCAGVEDVFAQTTQTPLSPAYKRARLRKLLEGWEARYPVVERQIVVSKEKLEELAPQVQPAQEQADTLRDQTRIAREKLDAITDAVVDEIGATRGLSELEQELALAEAELKSIQDAVRSKLADDATYKLKQQAVAEAGAKVESIKGDATVTHEQRLAIVTGELAARNDMIAYENAALEADPSYTKAKTKVDELTSKTAKLRTEVIREAQKDERVDLAEKAARDAQRATVEANKLAADLTRDFRLYRTRYQSATTELAQLERLIAEARSELGYDRALR